MRELVNWKGTKKLLRIENRNREKMRKTGEKSWGLE